MADSNVFDPSFWQEFMDEMDREGERVRRSKRLNAGLRGGQGENERGDIDGKQ